MGRKQISSWREPIGLIDSVLEFQEPLDICKWIDRYGRSKSGNRYALSLPDTQKNNDTHDTLVITDTEIGVQENRYDIATGNMNRIFYMPAYKYVRAAGGLAIASIIISKDGGMVIPLMRQSFASMAPDDVIQDMHAIMSIE